MPPWRRIGWGWRRRRAMEGGLFLVVRSLLPVSPSPSPPWGLGEGSHGSSDGVKIDFQPASRVHKCCAACLWVVMRNMQLSHDDLLRLNNVYFVFSSPDRAISRWTRASPCTTPSRSAGLGCWPDRSPGWQESWLTYPISTLEQGYKR